MEVKCLALTTRVWCLPGLSQGSELKATALPWPFAVDAPSVGTVSGSLLGEAEHWAGKQGWGEDFCLFSASPSGMCVLGHITKPLSTWFLPYERKSPNNGFLAGLCADNRLCGWEQQDKEVSHAPRYCPLKLRRQVGQVRHCVNSNWSPQCQALFSQPCKAHGARAMLTALDMRTRRPKR